MGEYTNMVQRLAKPGQRIIDGLTPQTVHLWHMASCICGEAGELFDAINAIEELGDIEFYMEGLQQGLGISRGSTLENNIEKLSKRYHSGAFSNEQAIDRADKQFDRGEPMTPNELQQDRGEPQA